MKKIKKLFAEELGFNVADFYVVRTTTIADLPDWASSSRKQLRFLRTIILYCVPQFFAF